MEAILKKVKIQTGVVKRISKERTSYEQEIITLAKQVEDMKSCGKDEHDIKKRIECLDESRMMIPDCTKRLANAIDVLRGLVRDNKEIEGEEIMVIAKSLLEEITA
ncbi:unnamed protein product [Clavelina lepadiformis]|uniref:Tubulin-specific chaperone A n=1 Tax=Clavelina lepadiformis TaxID=159417 RepID=A0ABP0FB89_CLALP